MRNDSYVAIDIETTGLQPKTDKIIEIGAWKVIDGTIKDSYHSMVNPYLQLPERIMELTGITDELICGAPDIRTVIHEATAFCEGLPLLGHHVIFDYSFLKKAAVNEGLEFEHRGIDTLKLCRRFMPEGEKKNLDQACIFFGVERAGAHRALGDAGDAHHLYRKLREQYARNDPGAFLPEPLIYKVKREQPPTKKQKEHLRDLVKYHRIDLTVQIDYLSRNEISRLTDKIISQYGRLS